jgi:hypothetical protein
VTPEKIIQDLIDILKIVAWPALVIWIAWFLKDEVKRAALRLIEIGPSGAKFAPPAQQTATPTEGVPLLRRGRHISRLTNSSRRSRPSVVIYLSEAPIPTIKSMP